MTTTGYSTADLLDFLEHAADRGLMPAATAGALAVACRNVFAVLSDRETADVRELNLDDVVRRFQNKRARDFSPASLRTYASRVARAVKAFVTWRSDPANFRAVTRSTAARRRNNHDSAPAPSAANELVPGAAVPVPMISGAYQTAFPLRPGHVVTFSNVPGDLSVGEAERLAQFIRMLAVEANR